MLEAITPDEQLHSNNYFVWLWNKDSTTILGQ